MAAIRRPEAIDCPTHERLDLSDLRARQTIEFRYLDNPHAGRLHRGVLTAKVGYLICEPWLPELLQCRGFLDSLLALKDQTAVRLDSRIQHARHRRDEPALTNAG